MVTRMCEVAGVEIRGGPAILPLPPAGRLGQQRWRRRNVPGRRCLASDPWVQARRCLPGILLQPLPVTCLPDGRPGSSPEHPNPAPQAGSPAGFLAGGALKRGARLVPRSKAFTDACAVSSVPPRSARSVKAPPGCRRFASCCRCRRRPRRKPSASRRLRKSSCRPSAPS